MWRGPWPGRLVLAFVIAQAALFGLLAVWPWVSSPLAALQTADLRGQVWLGSGFALMAVMVLPLFVLRARAAKGALARILVLLALLATVLVNWQMAGEYARLIPMNDAPLELARALTTARVQGVALALFALAMLRASTWAEALG